MIIAESYKVKQDADAKQSVPANPAGITCSLYGVLTSKLRPDAEQTW